MPNRLSSTLRLAACSALLALAAGCASPPGASRVRLSDADHVYALRAAGGGMYEIEAGRLAATRAGRADVQSFGQMLAQHHGEQLAELTQLLRERGIPGPGAMPAAPGATLARMAPLSGPEFDRFFVRRAGVQDHVAQIALFEQASRDVADPALRAWFARWLPALRAHLGAAHQLAAALPG